MKTFDPNFPPDLQTNQSKDKLIKNLKQKLTIVGNKKDSYKNITKMGKK